MRTSFALLSAVWCIGVPFLAGCGGGGGSDSSGMVIQGTITEAGGAHSGGRQLILRHTDGQRIEDVEVCALGECSTTDGQGQWGFVAPGDFDGGDVQFSINGHGIATSSVFAIPGGGSEVFLDLRHVEGGRVEAHSITVDGTESSHVEGHGHEHP